jgi:hypothetical protein
VEVTTNDVRRQCRWNDPAGMFGADLLADSILGEARTGGL